MTDSATSPAGELALIEAIRALVGSPAGAVRVGIGDDAAVLDLPRPDGLVVTTDMVLDGTHFDSRQHSLERIGRKALACSLSDVAAMACRPLAAVVAVALPHGMSVADGRRIHAGIQQLAEAFDCPLVGGDVTSWSQRLCVCVTMLAQPPQGRQPVLRSGARVGDRVYLSGPVGGSLLGRHMDFVPRVELADRLADAAELHAMIDVSDGVATDLQHVCRASDVGAELLESSLRQMIHADAHGAARQSGRDPLDHALQDGEDFELIAVSPQQLEGIKGADAVRCIGQIVPHGLWLVDVAGRRQPIEPAGFEHLR